MITGHEEFDEQAANIWSTWLALGQIVRSQDDDVASLGDEVDLRDHFYSYANAFDSKDLGRIISHFAEDAVLTTDRGRYAGIDAIQDYYQPSTVEVRFSYHRIQNAIIRVTDPGVEGWIAASFHSPFVGFEVPPRSQHGRYLAHLGAAGGSWKFLALRISVDQNWDY